MRYSVTLRYRPEGGRQPHNHPSTSDHQMETIGLLPGVGDQVHLESMGGEDEPSFDGQVVERHFRYRGGDMCDVDIVVGPARYDKES